MISQTAEYALRATVYLAAQGPSPQRTSDISESTKVPQAYLAKVLQGLASKGLVVMRRGVGGGVKLARPSAELTIFDVVDAIAPIERVSKCPISDGDEFCTRHDRLNEAIGNVENAYRSTTLADLVSNQCRPGLCPSTNGKDAIQNGAPNQAVNVSLQPKPASPSGGTVDPATPAHSNQVATPFNGHSEGQSSTPANGHSARPQTPGSQSPSGHSPNGGQAPAAFGQGQEVRFPKNDTNPGGFQN